MSTTINEGGGGGGGGWRIFVRDVKSGFFLEAFQSCTTREEVDAAIEQAKKERRDIKVMNVQTWTMETVAQ